VGVWRAEERSVASVSAWKAQNGSKEWKWRSLD
jgi:hypothetical protein